MKHKYLIKIKNLNSNSKIVSSSADYPFTTIACELFAVNQSYHTLLVEDW